MEIRIFVAPATRSKFLEICLFYFVLKLWFKFIFDFSHFSIWLLFQPLSKLAVLRTFWYIFEYFKHLRILLLEMCHFLTIFRTLILLKPCHCSHYFRQECSNKNGKKSGSCANGFGVCCICEYCNCFTFQVFKVSNS